MRIEAPPLPRAFIWRRLHSLTGLFLVLYIIEHLLTNSQAALWLGDDGRGFIDAVNMIHDLPYLFVVELFLLGAPILIHTVWGILYLRTGRLNSFPTDGSSCALTQYPRNHAYSWQRITSWLLVVGIVAHVIHMRFLEFPESAQIGAQTYYMVRVKEDPGLYPLGVRLNYKVWNQSQVEQFERRLEQRRPAEGLLEEQKEEQEKGLLQALKNLPLKKGQVIVVAKDFGTADLLMLRNTFQMPIMIALYTLFVLAACYHGFNGLFTAMITWGVTLTERAQVWMRRLATFLMVLVAFLGLAAVWLTYWNLNL